MSEVPVAVGQVLASKYRVERVLGQGGMGVVVAATHLQLDRRVAIKFLLPAALAHEAIVERFAREARAASKIVSEHVAKVIDVGALESGAPYMVMEYLEGNDLADEIAQKGPLPVEQAVSWILQALEALAEAHAHGIVHRDVKPANLFLAKRPDKSTIVKVLDFGISKVPVGEGAVATATTAVMGSPLYMSPEQLMSSKSVDARSDVWSVGIVLYEALCGAPPYRADTMPEIVALILQGPLAPPRSLRADLPAELEAVICRCLEKTPAARYANVAELARDLAPFASDGKRAFEKIARILDVDPRSTPSAEKVAATLPLALSTPVQTGSGTEDRAWTTAPAGKKRLAWLPYAVGGAVVVIGVAIGVKVVTAPRAHAVEPTTSSTAATDVTPPPPSALVLPDLGATAVPSSASSVATASGATSAGAAPIATTIPATHPKATNAVTSPVASTAASATAIAAPPDTAPSASAKKHFILK